MRSMYGPDTLLLASKKPRIQELVRLSRTLNEEQIRSLPEKPDVIRGLLLINLFGSDQSKSTLAEKIASRMQENHRADMPLDDQLCHVYRIATVADPWLKTGSGLIEIKEGWHWAILQDGKTYLGSSVVSISPTEIEKLKNMSMDLGDLKVGEFKDLEKRRRHALTA